MAMMTNLHNIYMIMFSVLFSYVNFFQYIIFLEQIADRILF